MRHATFHLGSKVVHASIDGDMIYSAVPLTTAELNEIRATDATLTATQAIESVHAHPPKWRKRWRQEHAGTAEGGNPGEVRPVVDHLKGSESQVPKESAKGSDSILRGPESKAQEVTLEPGEKVTVEAKDPPRKPWFGR